MLVQMPYIFDVVAVERNSRKPAHLYFGDWHPVDIEEVSGADAPVATQWEDWLEEGVKSTLHTRWHAGRHWMPPCMAAASEGLEVPGDLASGATLMKMVARNIGPDYGRREALDDLCSGRLGDFDPTTLREVLYTNRQGGIEDAEKAAREFILVDGDTYIAVHEPTYRISVREPVHEGERESTVAITVEQRPGEHSQPLEFNPYLHPRFRADRGADVDDYVRSRFPQYAISFRQSIEVLQPQSILFDDDAFSLEWTARRMISVRDRWNREVLTDVFQMLRNMPAKDAAAWFGLRDTLEGVKERTAGIETVVPFLESLSGSLPPHGYRDEIDDALARWRLRPLREAELASADELKP